MDRGPWYSWAFRELGLQYYHETFGDRSRVERFFGSLKRRTRVFFNNINARRSKIASLGMLMNLFFVYYNGLTRMASSRPSPPSGIWRGGAAAYRPWTLRR